MAFCVVGCLSNGTNGKSASTTSSGSRSFSSTTVGGTTTSSDSQCTVFSNNANDLATCVSCKQSLCPCTTYFPNSNTCQTTDISACTVSETLLVACVHENVRSAGGSCTGLKCGDNQVADFVNCVCKDATPPSSIGAAPGQGDQSSPYMEPGFFIGNRFCEAASTTPTPTYTPVAHQCLLDNHGASTDNGVVAGGAILNKGTPPKHVTQAPVNVFTDVGYLRWDLGLDASQFSPFLPLNEKLAFTASQSTIVGTASMYYQLKPNTTLSSTSLNWADCVEHFSGRSPGGGLTGEVSTDNFCNARSGVGTLHAPEAVSVTVSKNNEYSGTAKLEFMSLNGNSSNANVTAFSQPGNLKLNLTSSSTSAFGTNFGMAKTDGGRTALNAASPFDFSTDTTYDAGTDGATGLFSNIGYYKYTWGPLRVKKITNPSDTASTSVTGSVALNVNLGYSPISVVQSSAMSPEGIVGNVATRDCSSSATPSPCVVTGVYRAPGGGIITQSYSPRFPGSRQASNVDALPAGISMVSTPKIIEDVSQMANEPATTSTVTPARLRVFARGADGNIYMSRFFGGRWADWLSLGRPWACDPNAGSGTGTQCDGANLPAAYRAYNSDNYSALNAPSVWDNTVTTQIDKNNGISIASEPVVASYMITDTALVPAGNGVKGYIAVFVRVSQLKSLEGATAFPAGQGKSYGPYHNAVFYTVAAVSSPPITNSTTPYFDSVGNWSQWQPVLDSTGDVMRIQGNPTALITRNAANNEVRAYVFGTEAPGLHPPIAPKQATNTSAILGAAVAIQPGWYNYGNMLVFTSLRLDDPASSYENASGNYSTNIGRASWATFGRYLVDTGAAPGVLNSDRIAITSDWTWAPVDPGAGAITANTSIRLFASAYSNLTMTSGAAGESGVSPYLYTDRRIYYVEFTYTAVGNRLTASCRGTYNPSSGNFLGFVGNVNAVNLGDHARAGTIGSPGQNNSMFIFGRAPCPTKACDNVNPSVAYMTVNSQTECPGTIGDSFKMFFSGLSRTGPATDSTSDRTVQQVYTSSDVIPIYSKALDVNNADVPIYFFFRNASGKISNGIWNSKNGAIEGTQQFFVGPSGTLTN